MFCIVYKKRDTLYFGDIQPDILQEDMKVLVVLLLAYGCRGEAPTGPYSPSGWRPEGPSFELPEKQQGPASSQSEYGPPDRLSVQGLPSQPGQFQFTFTNGNQPATFNADLRFLDEQERRTSVERQRFRQFEDERNSVTTSGGSQQIASQGKTTFTVTPKQNDPRSTTAALPGVTGPPDSDTNEDSETKAKKDQDNDKATAGVNGQTGDAIPPQVLLNPLSQITLPSQYSYPVQLGQLQAPIFYQPPATQNLRAQEFGQLRALTPEVAQIAAIQTFLTQNQAILGRLQNGAQNQETPRSESTDDTDQSEQNKRARPKIPNDQPAGSLTGNAQNQQFVYPQPAVQSQNYEYQTPVVQYQPQYIQTQPQSVPVQPQYVQYQPQLIQMDPQFVASPQDNSQVQLIQPQTADVQSQYVQAQNLAQYPQNQGYFVPMSPQLLHQQYSQIRQQPLNQQGQQPKNEPYPYQITVQSQFSQSQQSQNQVQGQTQFSQSQGPYRNQNGNPQFFNTNTEGQNNNDRDEETQQDANFGSQSPVARSEYGAPPKTTNPPADDRSAEEGAVAVANAVADRRKRPARLRKQRPLFSVDKSGHLVQIQ